MFLINNSNNINSNILLSYFFIPIVFSLTKCNVDSTGNLCNTSINKFVIKKLINYIYLYRAPL